MELRNSNSATAAAAPNYGAIAASDPDEASTPLLSGGAGDSARSRWSALRARCVGVGVVLLALGLGLLFLAALLRDGDAEAPGGGASLARWARVSAGEADAVADGALPPLAPTGGAGGGDAADRRAALLARTFLDRACPEFLAAGVSEDDDRLVKAGREIESLMKAADEAGGGGDGDASLNAGLGLLVEELRALASGNVVVPKVRFGKTELQMPILTLGGMRFQQSWNRGGAERVTNMTQVRPEVQDNLLRILRRALDLGINHIETAAAYGSSELQLGAALEVLLAEEGGPRREDLIVQTKIPVKRTAAEFRAAFEKSLTALRLDYVDLFAFHCVSDDGELDLLFDGDGTDGTGSSMDAARELVAAGRIRHVGFSSHGRADFISKMIRTGAFEFANIHYHAFGSYTASGDGTFGGNLQNVRLMKEMDMGVFIISPFDKGGKLYVPSKKLRSLTLPDLEPIDYGAAWLWTHVDRDVEHAPVHTIVNGAARPSDLDQAAVAAYLTRRDGEGTLKQVRAAEERLRRAAVDALGAEWVESWFKGVPNCETNLDKIQFGQMVWMYNLVQAYGMLDFCRDRYRNFEGNSRRWNSSLATPENIERLGSSWWVMPGCEIESGQTYAAELAEVPVGHSERVLSALDFVHTYCSSHSSVNDVPSGWGAAYDMRPWTEFPGRR